MGKSRFFIPKNHQTKIKDLTFWTKLTKKFLNYKNGNEQLQKVTKNSSIQKVQKQYQTKLGLFMTKSLQ